MNETNLGTSLLLILYKSDTSMKSFYLRFEVCYGLQNNKMIQFTTFCLLHMIPLNVDEMISASIFFCCTKKGTSTKLCFGIVEL